MMMLKMLCSNAFLYPQPVCIMTVPYLGTVIPNTGHHLNITGITYCLTSQEMTTATSVLKSIMTTGY